MFCPACGNELPDGAVICEKCGMQVSEQPLLTPQSSGLNAPPPEIHKFNWNAFFFGWIWAIANKLRGWAIVLLIFSLGFKIVPALLSMLFHNDNITMSSFTLLGLVYIVLLGRFGALCNELAWRSRGFRDAEHFNEVQRRWRTFTTLLICFYLVGCCVAFQLPAFIHMSDEGNYKRCVRALLTVKDGEAQYKKANNKYTSEMADLAAYIVPKCQGKRKCDKDLIEWMKEQENAAFCKDIELKTVKDATDFQVIGTTRGRAPCGICATSKGYYPDTSSGCSANTKLMCP